VCPSRANGVILFEELEPFSSNYGILCGEDFLAGLEVEECTFRVWVAEVTSKEKTGVLSIACCISVALLTQRVEYLLVGEPFAVVVTEPAPECSCLGVP
jgi:hypothetical protein